MTWPAIISGVTLAVAAALLAWNLNGFRESDDPTSQRNSPRKSFRFWGAVRWGVFAALVYVGLTIRQDASAATGSGSTGELISLGLGLVGLVITALTGMALATAWRALDDAREANKTAKQVIATISEREDRLLERVLWTNIHMNALHTDHTHFYGSRLRPAPLNTINAFEGARKLVANCFDHPSIAKVRRFIRDISEDDDSLPHVAAIMGYDGAGLAELIDRDKDATPEDKRAAERLRRQLRELGYTNTLHA